jgi:2-haloacid dehalogenase
MGRVSEGRWATFDCYGTLIDWNGGLRKALGSDELLARYHEVEPEVQREDPSRSYREVMTEVSRRVGGPDDLAESPPSWEPFPEVPAALEEARGRGWRLAILSNTDRDFIDASMARIGVEFELAIVASEIGSYKPAHGHWRAFELETKRLPDVHVGASLFHDVAPAQELELPTVWINRLDEAADPIPNRELPTLDGLAGALDGLA